MRGSRISRFPFLLLCTRHGFLGKCHLANSASTGDLPSPCAPCSLLLHAAATGAFCLCVNDFPLISEGQVMLGVVVLSRCSPGPFPLCSSVSQCLCSVGGRLGAVGDLPWPFPCPPQASLLLSATCALNTVSLLS